MNRTSLEEEGDNGSPRKKTQNKCLDPSGGNLNLFCCVNVAIQEVEDMVDLVIVGKIRGINPNLKEMKEWVQKNWTGHLTSVNEISGMSKGLYRFTFNIKKSGGNSKL